MWTCRKLRSWSLGKIPDTLKDSSPTCLWGMQERGRCQFHALHWLKCSGIHGSLKPDPSFKCNRCLVKAHPIDGRPLNSLTLDGHHLAVLDSFCYLRDCISAGGGCEAATVNRIRASWGKFWEMLPILCAESLSLHIRGKVFDSCIRRLCFMHVNAGPWRVLMWHICWGMRGQCSAGCVPSNRLTTSVHMNWTKGWT